MLYLPSPSRAFLVPFENHFQGTITISLKTRVPEIRNRKPRSYHGRNSSQPMAREAAQMRTVLEASIVDLYAAEAYLVTETAVVLKEAIEHMSETEKRIKAGYCPYCSKAKRVFSRYPLWQRAPSHLTYWKIGSRITQ